MESPFSPLRRTARIVRPGITALATAALGACASTVPPDSPVSSATVPLAAASALQRAGDDPTYQPPADAPTAYIHFEQPHDLEFNIANVHLDNESCADRQEFAGDPASRSFRGKIQADGEITLSTWSDATWVGPQPFDIEFCNAIFTFSPEPGQAYLVARPRLESDCRVDVFSADGALVDVEMRQPVSAESNADAWCQERLPGNLGRTNALKQLVDLPDGLPRGVLIEL